MTVKLQAEHHLECLSLTGGCTGSSESTLVNATLLEITCHGSLTRKCHNHKSQSYFKIKRLLHMNCAKSMRNIYKHVKKSKRPALSSSAK